MLEKIKKVDWKDVSKRAFKTFIQAFLSSISIESIILAKDYDTFKTVLISIGIAGVSAGISAVWNMLLGMMEE